MRSSLTRRIFRQLASNKVISYGHCGVGRSSCSRIYPVANRLQGHSSIRRTFLFGSTKDKPRRKPKGPQRDPGLAELVHFVNSQELGHRQPPRGELLQAVNRFCKFKVGNEGRLNDHDFQYLSTAVLYLVKPQDAQDGTDFTEVDLMRLLELFQKVDKILDHAKGTKLADAIYDQFSRHGYDAEERPWDEMNNQNILHEPLYMYLRALSLCGQGARIAKVLEDLGIPIDHGLWHAVLSASINEGNNDKVLGILQKLTGSARQDALEDAAVKAATSSNITLCKTLFEMFLHEDANTIKETASQSGQKALQALLERCIWDREMAFGQNVVNHLLELGPDKVSWDCILKWAIIKGRSLDRLKDMIEIMDQNLLDRSLDGSADTETLNGLIETAYSAKLISFVDELNTIFSGRGIHPDCSTYLLHMAHCIQYGDLRGAQLALGEAQTFDVPTNVFQKEMLPLLNILMQRLCEDPEPDHATIMQIVHEVTEKAGRFEPPTVAALTKLHLQRGELLDAIDILQTHAHRMSRKGRLLIEATLVRYISDRNIATSNAWEAYTLLREIFPEIAPEVRTHLMREFFTRGRCDMGVHVFGHMRQAEVSASRPTEDIYVACFEGIAQFGDSESTELVHNMLKMDVEVEPNTRLRNALMIAYLECGRADRSFDFWDEIVFSREGPTYNSICIVLRACETSPFGGDRADEVWRQLQKFGVEVTPEIYDAYVGALAGQGLVDEAIEAVSNMEDVVGIKPNIATLGILFNATGATSKRDRVADKIRSTYPTVWEELSQLGVDDDGDFAIARSLSA